METAKEGALAIETEGVTGFRCTGGGDAAACCALCWPGAAPQK